MTSARVNLFLLAALLFNLLLIVKCGRDFGRPNVEYIGSRAASVLGTQLSETAREVSVLTLGNKPRKFLDSLRLDIVQDK